MSDIFISYASEDFSRVRLLADALSDYGWSVWWDRQIPAGKTFDQLIADALADAQCVVVVWSRHSVASSWVREEADEGRKRGVLIPVLIDKVSPPFGFGRIHAASLTEWDGGQDSEAFQRLAADIAGLINPPPGRTPPPRPIVPITPELPAGASPPVIPGPESRPARRFSFQRTDEQTVRGARPGGRTSFLGSSPIARAALAGMTGSLLHPHPTGTLASE